MLHSLKLWSAKHVILGTILWYPIYAAGFMVVGFALVFLLEITGFIDLIWSLKGPVMLLKVVGVALVLDIVLSPFLLLWFTTTKIKEWKGQYTQ